MTDLDEDIARIAAMRGRKAEDYTGPARPRPRLAAQTIKLLFEPTKAEATADIDDLPEPVRVFIRECPIMSNSLVWRAAIESGMDVGDLLAAAQAEAEKRLGQPLESFRRNPSRRRRFS